MSPVRCALDVLSIVDPVAGADQEEGCLRTLH